MTEAAHSAGISTMKALRQRLSKLQALAGIHLLRSSRWYDSYFGHWRECFRRAEALGLHILPVHYYSPIPDTRMADAYSLEVEPSSLEIDLYASLSLLTRLVSVHRPPVTDWVAKRHPSEQRYSFQNNAYLAGDAEILYAMISEYKPRKIIEIGCGNSSLIIAEALESLKAKDNSFECKYTCIEPYPPSYLTPPPSAVSRFEVTKLQEMPLEIFKSLGKGDVLFVDSSHVVARGSDVVHIYLKILPVLQPGVLIHIHDIFLPFDYPEPWLTKQFFFWNEQYLLQGLLSAGSSLKVILPTFALFERERSVFSKLLPSTQNTPNAPSSFWVLKQ